MLHLHIEPLSSPVSIILLLNLPQDGGDEEESQETGGEGDEELEEVQLGVLREGDDDPEGGLEVVNINIEGRVLLISKGVISFREAVFEIWAILLCQDHVFFFALFRRVSICQVHLGIDGAGYGEININIRLGRDILEVDGSVMFVLRLWKVERELVVDGEIVEATGVDGVAEVVVLGVALLTVVPGDALGCAETVAGPVDKGFESEK